MLAKTENTEVTVGDDTFVLPGGFKVAENSRDTILEGIVITDGLEETE